ncbi:hypothetical protein ACFFRR_007271 [Megaselia abdita]
MDLRNCSFGNWMKTTTSHNHNTNLTKWKSRAMMMQQNNLKMVQISLDFIIGADRNAHYTQWGSKDINSEGLLLFEFIFRAYFWKCSREGDIAWHSYQTGPHLEDSGRPCTNRSLSR